MRHSPTQKDIAAALGISKLTVHRALSGSGYVSQELRKRIAQCARRLGYSPNRNAKALFRQRRYAIAIFSTAEPSFFWDDVAAGAQIASKHITGYGIQVSYNRIPFADTDAYMRQLSRVTRAGIDAAALVNNVEYDMERVFSLLSRRKIPYITMNIDAPETERMCFVGPDYAEGGRIAAELLKKMLPERASVTAFLHRFLERTHLASARISQTMLDGFTRCLEEPGGSRLFLDVQTVDHQLSDARTLTILKEYLRTHAARLRGVYCIGTMQDVMGRAILQLGLANRVKVITYDLTPETETYLQRSVFTAAIYQNPTMQGYYAVKILENFLETGRRPDRDLLLVHDIVVKENIRINSNFESLIGMEY